MRRLRLAEWCSGPPACALSPPFDKHRPGRSADCTSEFRHAPRGDSDYNPGGDWLPWLWEGAGMSSSGPALHLAGPSGGAGCCGTSWPWLLGGWGRQGASQHSSGRSLSLYHWAVGPSLCPCDGRRTRGLVKLSKLLQVLQQWQGAGPAPLRACVLHRSPPSPERPGPQALGQCWCLPVWGLTP